MTPTNLPDLYARVVARRPELAVKELARDLSVYNANLLGPDGPIADSILAKWVKALPVGKALRHHAAYKDLPAEWSVAGLSLFCKGVHVGPTPLEALAAFWLEAP